MAVCVGGKQKNVTVDDARFGGRRLGYGEKRLEALPEQPGKGRAADHGVLDHRFEVGIRTKNDFFHLVAIDRNDGGLLSGDWRGNAQLEHLVVSPGKATGAFVSVNIFDRVLRGSEGQYEHGCDGCRDSVLHDEPSGAAGSFFSFSLALSASGNEARSSLLASSS